MKPPSLIAVVILLAALVPASGTEGASPAGGNNAAGELMDSVDSQRSREEIAREGHAGITFVENLRHAPYPYSGKYEDTAIPFFDAIDDKTGERLHTNRYGERISEKDHYSDGSVLFHAPPHFDPGKPFAHVVFFHGLNSNALESVRKYKLDEQIDASGRNVLLIAPQLARNAPDSSPGKFFRRGAFKLFMEEAAEVLPGRLNAEKYREGFAKAPVILAAFSGGYKAAAFVLDRGGTDERVRGVFLMDALYENVDKFASWLAKHARNAFFVGIYTPGSCERNMTELSEQIATRGVKARRTWPVSLSAGSFHIVPSSVEHDKIPILGPPERPLAALLEMVDLEPPRKRPTGR